MEKTTQLGKNRTGIQMSPLQTEKMLKEAKGARFTPGDESGIVQVRTAYIQASGPVGSVPPPGTAKGMLKSGMQALTGGKAHVLVDRIGERLAFERSGTRLYEAMITKCRAEANGAGQYLPLLEKICAEEAAHFRLLVGCMEKLGADPTAQTPAADIAGVESMGLVQVVTDPMTSFAQSLHAILVAELVDNDAWDELIALAEQLGQAEMARDFSAARDEERRHLDLVRTGHQDSTLRESSVLG